MLLHHFDHPLPWKRSKMATKHNYFKSLKLQSLHADPFSFHSWYKHNVIFTFTKEFVVIMLFLYFIVLFTFYACKIYTNSISNRHKTKNNIAIYKSLGKSKDQYIYTFKTTFTQSGALGFYN